MSIITTEQASKIAFEHFNITAKASKLDGYVDENFLLKTGSNEKFLLKISSEENSEQLDFQVEILKYLSTKEHAVSLPEVVSNNEGNSLSKFQNNKTARILTWLPGRLWATVNPKTESLRISLGEAAGSLTTALKDFEHPAAHRNLDWDLANSTWTSEHINRFLGKAKEIVQHFQNRFEEIQTTYKNLPKSIVHNDLNDYNILVSDDLSNPKVSGLIDFGDSVFTQTINDLAIVLAYAIMDLPDPLSAALEVVKGYNKNYKISENELKCLYILVGMRLVTTVTNASIKKEEFPNDDYYVISEKPAWNLLKKWFDVNENFAYYSFRNACGYSAHPLEEKFENWSKKNQVSLKTMFPTVASEKVMNLDMSVGSTLLGNPSEYSDAEVSEFKLKQFQKHFPKTILLNGYLETRPFYTTDAFKSEGNNGPQYRTVHLGTDFWVPAQTAVHAPFNGTVKIIHHNNYDKDYGPMLILEHTFEESKFYSLYGHLTLTSLGILKVGQQVKQGDLIAYIGSPNENGNWAPHLHFQLILDLLGNDENFNGVALPSNAEIWKSICPNPNFIFKEELNTSEEKISEENIINFRNNHLGKGLSLSYDKPLHIVRGEGVYLIDIDGRKYLDTVNNVNHVGHQHPKVVAAGQKQMAVLNTNTRYLHEEIIGYAEALLKKLPPHLSVIHIVNSGSEANELALRMAKTITGNKDILAIEVGYHGNTNAVMDVSSYKFEGKGGFPKPETTHILPLPDSYRGKYTSENCGIDYANHAKEIIENLKVEGKEIAGFIGESMISCGGQIVPPKNYFKEVYKHVHEAGGICIADEVQTGFGRMGKTFWAFELYDVQPDIVTMGKPAGNAHPLAIVACTKEVAEKFNTGMEYFNTFGGNPVSCAIGRAVLEVVEEENLQENALKVGGFLIAELKTLQKQFPIIGDVRGEGLFLGFELNDSNKNPLPEHASYLANRMKQLGILMSIDGPDHNVLKIKPPMVFSKENAEELIFRLKTVFGEDYMLKF
ncbi:4-aminobutyrate aminotransferase family protein [Aequorivita sublithincola DSM 14238]|uniref:4-aminobutyrate aminotransferase family protein n=1 Tax=Aequorivita sublithincola (strain DSM 14238 / LMG 21431 / ACAM 643 / 9-3) TaxID=746697 RepID=I3YVU7_AEQSU|nr:aminotransferase class III-fold pyridoxal phosphate-dependent enzyme [Aequorivita sublithincola]AFL81115.1 4-aminobutyrate aminotransferase family protein [Aequorivita sublithincola DSM 14238]